MGKIPGGITCHRFGRGLAALVGHLSGSPHVSKRGIGDFLEQVFGLPLALGSVSNLEQELSKALAVPHAEAVRRAAVRNVDESGWKRQGLSCPEGKTARCCVNVLRFEESL